MPLTGAGAALMLLFAILGGSGVGVAWQLLIASFTTAVVLAPRRSVSADRLSAVGIVPLGFLVLMSWVVSVGTMAGAVDVGLWDSRGKALATWSALAISLVAAAAWRGGEVRIIRGDTSAGVSLAVLWLVGVVVAIIRPFEVLTRIPNGGTDFGRHLVHVERTVIDGALWYDTFDYPRALHATVTLPWTAAGGERFADAWLALESVLWLVLCLTAMAMVVIGARLSRRLDLPPWVSSGAAPALIVPVFVQSMWISAMFSLGFATSIAAGFIVTTVVVAAADGRWAGSWRANALLTAATVVLSHTWPLLCPVTAIPLLASLVVSCRRRTSVALSMVTVLAGVAISLPPGFAVLQAQGEDGLSGEVLFRGESGLRFPEWWWGAAAVLAVLAAFVLWRRGSRSWVMTWTLMAVTGGLVTLAIWRISGGSFPDIGYYAMKTLWTMSVLVAPTAVVAICWLGVLAVRRLSSMQEGVPRVALTITFAAVSVLALTFTLGRIASARSYAWEVARFGGRGMVPVQIPVLTAVEDSGVKPLPSEQPVAWGITPYADIGAEEFTGYVDQVVKDTLVWFGEGSISGELNKILYLRDAVDLCRYLRENPTNLRVTGPNPQAGLQWLRDSGCPEGVIQADKWVVAQINDAWFEGFPFQGEPYSYLTWQQYQEARSPRTNSRPDEATSPRHADKL